MKYILAEKGLCNIVFGGDSRTILSQRLEGQATSSMITHDRGMVVVELEWLVEAYEMSLLFCNEQHKCHRKRCRSITHTKGKSIMNN